MNARRNHRPAFALSGIVATLAALLIGASILKFAVVPMRQPVAGGAYGSGYQVGYYAAPVVLLGVIGLLGWITYRVTGRSDEPANMIMGILISIFLAGYGYQIFDGLTNPNPGPTTAQKNPSTFNQRIQQQANRTQQLLNQQARKPSPTPPAPLTQTPPPSNPTTTPSTPQPRPIAAQPKPVDPNVQAQLGILKDAVTTQITQGLTTLDPALTAITKPPRADLADLRKRATLIKAAKDALSPLPARLRALTDEAKSAAEKGGSENALHDGITFANAFSASERAFAADQLIRLLDQAASETQLLTDNYGRWKTDKNGKIDSKDFQLQSSANSDRFFITSGLKDKDKTIQTLKGE